MDTTTPKSLGRFLRLKAVVDETGLPPSSIYAEMAKGAFPKPVKLSANRVAWLENSIEAWKAERIAERDQAAA
ncbi:helix-turn-helix transcriptional regulator [Reyranella sp.]|uniref:helix-turn-helix transcriptional regulator n=1 Tax=Reyranella sp. TaxID=1929291 RepID=UPI003D0AD97F